MLVESRTGANITEDELLYLDELVSPLIQRGHSVHHIAVHNADSLEVSEKSIYRYVPADFSRQKN
jgi:IS30 family transposase